MALRPALSDGLPFSETGSVRRQVTANCNPTRFPWSSVSGVTEKPFLDCGYGSVGLQLCLPMPVASRIRHDNSIILNMTKAYSCPL
jgi:hypothetical protein